MKVIILPLMVYLQPQCFLMKFHAIARRKKQIKSLKSQIIKGGTWRLLTVAPTGDRGSPGMTSRRKWEEGFVEFVRERKRGAHGQGVPIGPGMCTATPYLTHCCN